MTVEELIETLKQLPKETTVYIEADHGQNPEQAHYINVTKDKDLPYYGEDVDWDALYDVDKLNNDITGVLIS